GRMSTRCPAGVPTPARRFAPCAGAAKRRMPGSSRDRLREIPRLDQGEAVDDVLGLGERPVMDALLLAPDDLARSLKRMSGVFDVALFTEFLEPGEPFLHGFLHFLRRLRRWIAAAEEKGKFAHCVFFRVLHRPLDV